MTSTDDTTRRDMADADADADVRDLRSAPLADDTDPDREEQGRIGYGRLGRWSPVGLALLILLTLGIIYILDRDDASAPGSPGDAPVTTGALAEPRPAPEFDLPLLDGSGRVSLEDLRGRTVVLNFWASWCGPCREEMPELQALAASDATVAVIGVGAKTDDPADVEAFLAEVGVTYPIGRDTEGGDSSRGAIERAYSVPGFPATYIITPEGLIHRIVFGPVDTGNLAAYVAEATRAATGD